MHNTYDLSNNLQTNNLKYDKNLNFNFIFQIIEVPDISKHVKTKQLNEGVTRKLYIFGSNHDNTPSKTFTLMLNP